MDSNHKNIIRLIRAISGQANVLTIPRVFVGLCKGSHRAALLLSQIVYWSDKGSDDGWFWKTRNDWRVEIGMNQHAVETALKLLPWVHTKVASVGRTPKTHYRVDLDALAVDVAAYLDTERKPINDTERKPINDTERKTINLQLGKTTTQQTTKRARAARPPADVPPAVAAWRTVTGRFPNKRVWPDISNTLGPTPDTAKLESIFHEWVKRGWNPNNVAGLLESYTAGAIRSRFREQTKPSKVETIVDAVDLAINGIPT